MNQKIKWPLAYNTWGTEENDAIIRVLSSGRITIGPEVEAFEDEFAKFVGAKYAVMCNSGSSANLLAVAAMHTMDGTPGEFIVPAIGWATTYSPLYQHGYKMKVVDVDETFNMGVSKLEEALGRDTKGIMLVHTLGVPADTYRIRDIAKERKLWLLEDCCESLGTYSVAGEMAASMKHVGTFGDMGTFSFFFSHHISTGEGGMVVTDSYQLYNMLRSLRSHGWGRGIAGLPKNKNKKYDPFTFHFPGYNLRPMEMQAAVGRVQLRKFSGMAAARQHNADDLWKAFKDLQLDGHIQLQQTRGKTCHFAFGMLDKHPTVRLESILDNLGIEHRPLVAGNILRQPVAEYYDFTTQGTPLADQIHEQGLYIGCGPVDLSGQIGELSAVLANRYRDWEWDRAGGYTRKAADSSKDCSLGLTPKR